MNITFDEAAIQENLQNTANEAMSHALATYSVQSQLREAIAQQVLEGALGAAITAAVRQVDLATMTASIAQQLTRHMIAATASLLTEATVDMLYRLQGRNDYDKDSEAVKARLRAELQAKTREG